MKGQANNTPSKAVQSSAKARSASEAILTRVLSGATYAVVILVCILWGTIPFCACVCVMSWLSCSEFFRLARRMGRAPFEIIGLTFAVLLTCLPLLSELFTSICFALFLLVAGIVYVYRPRASIGDVAVSIVGPLYTGYLFSALVQIRMMHPAWLEYSEFWGALLVFGVLASIWGADALAYLVGSRLGKHKMIPAISPNKTWEGFLGSLGGSFIVWLLMWLLGIPGITWYFAIATGILVALAGVIGDLFESRLKRAAGVKDSGTFMPGHGGMLDRSDSILFAAITAYFLLRLGGFV